MTGTRLCVPEGILLLLFIGIAAPPPAHSSSSLARATSSQRTSTSTGRKPIASTEPSHYSRGKEEVIVRDFFQDRRNGVFLDVGCWHAIQASNTYYLEKRLGWSGIAVDALPELAAEWKKVRPASRFYNYIVTDKDAASQTFYRAALSDISSVKKPKTGPAGNPIAFEKITIPAITLTDLLRKAAVTKVDYVSMDIEGAEVPALEGFDIRKFKPQLVCIEVKVQNRKKVSAYFEANGYERLRQYDRLDITNWYFASRPAGKQ